MGLGTVMLVKPNGTQDEEAAGNGGQADEQARNPPTAHELFSVSINFYFRHRSQLLIGNANQHILTYGLSNASDELLLESIFGLRRP